MGWFDQQIKQRIQADDDAFADAFATMAAVVMGQGLKSALMDDLQKTQNAVDEILRFYRVKSAELPVELTDINEQLEYLLRPSGVMRRVVRLQGAWYKDAVGAFLATNKTGGVVAVLPRKLGGYHFFDYQSGRMVRLTKKTANLLETEALCFYKPLPLRVLGIQDLLLYMVQSLGLADYLFVGGATLAVALIGLITPLLNNILFSRVIESGNWSLFTGILVMLVGVGVASVLIGTVKTIVLDRINMKTGLSVQAASMMRVLSLPASFFKRYSAGELSSRAQSINSLCSMLGNAVFSTGLTAIFSFVYIAQIFVFAPALVVPALLITLTTVGFSLVTTFVQMKVTKKTMEIQAKESGMTYALITGVQKLKLAGAEKRAFANWAQLYSKGAKLLYDPPLLLKLNVVIGAAITMVGTIVLYYAAVVSGVSVANYFAFNASYGMVSAAFFSLAGVATVVANIKPVLDMVKPILTTAPEIAQGKKVLTKISGGIELSNVSFRYSETMPLVVDDLSLKVKAGQYIALVGKTGCGKSTLMRLMLGFETPQKGAIYFDGKDITSIDLKSLRRRIGVVMQNGKLFAGDIFANITISAPWLTLEEAWQAAELAGIAQDIRDMPMGMNTIISEGSGGISGGQRQRLMIARAIAPKPKILLFDEATSALDNLTQKTVTQSLQQLKCTRVVIAHRLSTIQECDRILVLEQGRIIEDGNYAQLLANKGYFAQLVARQRVDEDDFVGKTTMF